MSRAFQTQIWVVQAGSPIVKVGEGEYPSSESSSPLMISYHRKMYGLGEVSLSSSVKRRCLDEED